MGRRSTKTTKTGKFMNPTDQFRKQQRRKELKKNKKQRKAVREAVLRMKDVGQMLEEIEEIEKLQMTTLTSDPMPNEKGLEEKKAKLHASVHRVAAYYQGEDPKKAQEIRLMIMESEKKRREMSAVYNSYRAARSEYNIDQIPLPDSGDGVVLPTDIPMPDEMGTRGLVGPLPPGLVPPGPPPNPPPSDLPEYNVIELERKSVRFAAMVTDPGDGSDGESDEDDQSDGDSDSESDKEEAESQPAPPGPPPGLPPTIIAPPPLHPPPPPPLLAPSFPPHIGLPPGPPPGPPPSRFGGPKPLMPPTTPHIQSGAVLSTPSIRSHPPSAPLEDKPTTETGRAAVISAQPQLRNMTAEITKFMPTSLRVRRNHPKPAKLKPGAPSIPTQNRQPAGVNKPPPTQGDAYDVFMREMQGLL